MQSIKNRGQNETKTPEVLLTKLKGRSLNSLYCTIRNAQRRVVIPAF